MKQVITKLKYIKMNEFSESLKMNIMLKKWWVFCKMRPKAMDSFYVAICAFLKTHIAEISWIIKRYCVVYKVLCDSRYSSSSYLIAQWRQSRILSFSTHNIWRISNGNRILCYAFEKKKKIIIINRE